MSDVSQGPGWWLASDGRWYPPETWTGPPQMAATIPPQYPYAAAQPTAYQPYGAMPHGVAPRRTNGLAVASLVCSCAGVVPFFFGLPCIIGIVFGFVSRSQIRNAAGAEAGDGMALAGIIVGFCVIALLIIGVILIAVFASSQTCTNGFNTYSCSVS